MNSRSAYILFNMIDGLGPVKVRALLEYFETPEAVLEAGSGDLQRVSGIGARLAEAIAEQRTRKNPEQEQEHAQREGLSIITPLDEDYPALLREIYDPPLALYVRGRLQPSDRRSIAVVGSRQISHYGERVADRLSYDIAGAGCTVVSGLARGIDTVAHQAALKAKGRTLAVIGSAHDKLYPPENRDLADRIVESGAVISEYPMGREADRATFPYRNRIVSGMSLGVLVVEAPVKSGSLITADCALEHGRMVFAVPGRIDNKGSAGCHRLIKQGAKLVDSVNDIFEEFEAFGPESEPSKPARQEELPFEISDDEKKVCDVLLEEELDLDTLSRQVSIPVAQLGTLLLSMEMKKLIRVLPGRRVALNRSA